MAINIDLHTHTLFSGDGVSSPEDLMAAARAKGLNGIAITDHNTCDAVNYLIEKGLMRLDGLPVNERLLMLASQLDQNHAGWIAEAGLVRLGQLGNFRVRNVEGLQLRNAVKPHGHLGGFIRLCLWGLLAGGDQYK